MYDKALSDLVYTDSRFQTSVNLRIDLDNPEKIKGYIPTKASAGIMNQYLNDIASGAGKNSRHGYATALIGPYGKGKSHLVLVLLQLISGKKSSELSELVRKIGEVDKETGKTASEIYDQELKYLPVLISPSDLDLNKEFILSLDESLKMAGLEKISPDSYYSEALKVIEKWKSGYPEAYDNFQKMIKENGYTAASFTKELRSFGNNAYELFCKIYPKLSSGSRFDPIIRMDALGAYREVNDVLCSQYGYSGIFIVFDEFSKYVEGHDKGTFAADMETLQKMCELAGSEQKCSQINLLIIAHKSIKECGTDLDAAMRKQYEGVEGRLSERDFVVSGKNNYELIKNAIHKTELGCAELEKSAFAKTFEQISDDSRDISCFNSLFANKREFDDVVAKGCFPLTPLASLLLLGISEKVAQNERTVFTFISCDEYGSLNRLIKEQRPPQMYYVGADAIYDYFSGLFKENVSNPQIHNEWLKAEYAIGRSDDQTEKKVIKALALINMIGNTDELPAVDKTIALSLGMPLDDVNKAIASLKERQLILFRSRLQVLAFRNNVGINLDQEIKNITASMETGFQTEKELAVSSDIEYILPRIYNQKNGMTRYFRYVYMTAEQFESLPSVDMLLDKDNFADGCIVGIAEGNESDKKKITLAEGNSPEKKKIMDHCKKLDDERLIVIVPHERFGAEGPLKKAAAVRKMMADQEFISQNEVMKQELELYLEDLLFEINSYLDQMYLPENGRCDVLYKGSEHKAFKSAPQFNHFLSDICSSFYKDSPYVNYELINIRNVSGQYLKARNNLIDVLLSGADISKYENGTSPECMLYRNTIVRTGIMNPIGNITDDGSRAAAKVIEDFISESIGKKMSFDGLYRRLLGRDYGMRQGIIPLYIVCRLIKLNDMPVVYLQDNEVEVNAEIMNNINNDPAQYSLYIEKQNGEKEKYLQKLEAMFPVQSTSGIGSAKHMRFSNIVKGIQTWYRSLPQYARHFSGCEEEISGFRNIFQRQEINPREVLFEKLPLLFDKKADYTNAAKQISGIYDILSNAMDKELDRAAQEVRGVFGIREKDSLSGGLREWYGKQSSAARSYIGSSRCNNLMSYLGELKTSDDRAIVQKMSKIVLDIYSEDWTDDSLGDLVTALNETKCEIEKQSDERKDSIGTNTIRFTGSDGAEIDRTFNTEKNDSTSYFLMNAIESAINEFGDSLETNQKVSVLVQTLEKLIKNK